MTSVPARVLILSPDRGSKLQGLYWLCLISESRTKIESRKMTKPNINIYILKHRIICFMLYMFFPVNSKLLSFSIFCIVNNEFIHYVTHVCPFIFAAAVLLLL